MDKVETKKLEIYLKENIIFAFNFIDEEQINNEKLLV